MDKFQSLQQSAAVYAGQLNKHSHIYLGLWFEVKLRSLFFKFHFTVGFFKSDAIMSNHNFV